jgi:hypothetical protein
MTIKRMTILFVVLFSLVIAIPVLAHVPTDGTVIEGDSVPGHGDARVNLGDTRVQVQEVWGEPASCTTGYEVDDDATCDYPVEGLGHLGRIRVRFRGPDGGLPSASPDDVVSSVTWNTSVDWTTEAGGVNIEWANSVRDDPEAVLAAYPNAVISHKGLFGTMSRATDYELGIMIEWHYHFYSGFLGSSMTIFAPGPTPPPPPPPDPVTRVTNLSLYANKIKGNRTVWASVWVDDEYWNDAVGATVVLDWTYPNGTTERLEAVTSDSGVARFEMNKVKTGTHSIEVVDVIYLEHPFDRDYGTLTASVRVK